jgi:hypothetical protein
LLLLNSVFPKFSVRVERAFAKLDTSIKVDNLRVSTALKLPLVSIMNLNLFSVNGNNKLT